MPHSERNDLSLLKDFADRLVDASQRNFPLSKVKAQDFVAQAAGYGDWTGAQARVSSTSLEARGPSTRRSQIAEEIAGRLAREYASRPKLVFAGAEGIRQISQHIAQYVVHRKQNLALIQSEPRKSSATDRTGVQELHFFRPARADRLERIYRDMSGRLQPDQTDPWLSKPCPATTEILERVPGLLREMPEWYGGYTLLSIALRSHGDLEGEGRTLRQLVKLVEPMIPASVPGYRQRLNCGLLDNEAPIQLLARAARVFGECEYSREDSLRLKHQIQTWIPLDWNWVWDEPGGTRTPEQVGLERSALVPARQESLCEPVPV